MISKGHVGFISTRESTQQTHAITPKVNDEDENLHASSKRKLTTHIVVHMSGWTVSGQQKVSPRQSPLLSRKSSGRKKIDRGGPRKIVTFSISTASQMMSVTRATGSLLTSFRYSRQAKSVCRPSSRLMSSLLKHKPGMSPRFFNQNTAQKLPEKKIP